MNITELRQKFGRQIVETAQKYHAENVRVFGSVARGEATEESDIDLLVHFREGASLLDEAGLDLALNALLHRRVDIISDRAVRKELRQYIFDEAEPL